MSAAKPGQAAYEAWFNAAHAFVPAAGTTAAEVWARGTPDWHDTWEAAAKAGHAAIAAQDARPAPGLREAIEAKLADWRDYSKYRPTDTHDEITDHAAVEECAGELAVILDEHPAAEPKAAPELPCPVCGVTGAGHGVPWPEPQPAPEAAPK